MSCRTLYQANACVRPASSTVAGRMTWSRMREAPRSRPMPFTIPRNAVAPAANGWAVRANPSPPQADRRDRTRSERLRPRVSPTRVTRSAAAAQPKSPAPTT